MIVVEQSIQKAISSLESLIKKMEEGEGFSEEIPEDVKNLFDPMGQKKLKELYIDQRQTGKSIEDSLRTSVRLVVRSYKNNKVVLFKSLEKEVSKLKSRLNGKDPS